ncbi:MAG: DUF3990 domain-containing protein [Bacteroidales bacterium]|nr:DUF3990 domain-containing protein [Bacteroidales bacterium]
MILYHGTNAVIESVDLAQSRIGKDFGLGFYLTPDKQVARRQAERKLEQFGEGEATVYKYYIADEALTSLKTVRFDSYTLDWARFVLSNRKNRTRKQIHDYDIVIGPIADDVVGYQIRRVEEGIISDEQFLEEIKFHTITIQYLFASKKAVELLQRI